MGKRIELDFVFRPKRRQPSPASAVSVEKPARASATTRPRKAPQSTPPPPATEFPTSAGSAPAGTSAAAASDLDLVALRGKLSAALSPSEAKQLDKFLDRLDRQRKTKAAQMRRYRAKVKKQAADAQ